MTKRYNPPPNWPTPPAGWTPPQGWEPDPAWGPAPNGWQLWVEDPKPAGKPKPWAWIAAVVVALLRRSSGPGSRLAGVVDDDRDVYPVGDLELGEQVRYV